MRAMRGHVTAVGILNVIYNAGIVLGGLALGALWLLGISIVGGAVGSEQGAAQGGAVFAGLGLLGLLVVGLVLLPGLPGFIGGIGVIRRRWWARWVVVVCSVFNLLAFPLGTALGAYSLVVLLSSSVDDEFRGEAPLSY